MATDLKLEVQLGLADKLLGPLKRNRSSATALNKALRATQDQLRQVQQIQAFKTQQRDLQATSIELNDARENVRKLREQMNALGEQASNKMRTDFRKANEAIRDLTPKMQTQRNE